MLNRQEIIQEVCIRASVPAVRFEDGDVGKTELRDIIRAAQMLSDRELEVFDQLLREIRSGSYQQD